MTPNEGPPTMSPPERCSTPKECPTCHSENIFPTFDPTIDDFECVRCSNVFEWPRPDKKVW